jgi:predicted ATP-dependent endonuclease of OLD family
MTEMWRFVNDVSRDFNIQVFATTHSYDCVHSLATICREAGDSEGQITIHRIEAEKTESILFTAKQIQSAAEREIEIR